MPHLQDSDSEDTNTESLNQKQRNLCRQNSDSSGGIVAISTTDSTASSVSPTMMADSLHSPIHKHKHAQEASRTRAMMVLDGADRLLSLAATATKHSDDSETVVATAATTVSSQGQAPYHYNPSVDEDDGIAPGLKASNYASTCTPTIASTPPSYAVMSHSKTAGGNFGTAISPSPYHQRTRMDIRTLHQPPLPSMQSRNHGNPDSGPMMSIYGNNARLFPSPIRVKNRRNITQSSIVSTSSTTSLQESSVSPPSFDSTATDLSTPTSDKDMNHPSNLKYGLTGPNYVEGDNNVHTAQQSFSTAANQRKRSLGENASDSEYQSPPKQLVTTEKIASSQVTTPYRNSTQRLPTETVHPIEDHPQTSAANTTIVDAVEPSTTTFAKKKALISPTSSQEKIDDEDSLPSRSGAAVGPYVRSYHPSHPHLHRSFPPHVSPYHHLPPHPHVYHGTELIPPSFGHYHIDPATGAPSFPPPYYLPYHPLPPHVAASAGHGPMMHYRSPPPMHYGAFRGPHSYHPRHPFPGGTLHSLPGTTPPTQSPASTSPPLASPSVTLSLSSSPNAESMQQPPSASPDSISCGITKLYHPHPHAPPAPVSSSTPPTHAAGTHAIQSVAEWQRATLATGQVPSAKRCVPLKEPIPSKYWGEAEKTKDALLPDFHRLVNFPDYLTKPRSSSSSPTSGSNSPTSTDGSNGATNNASGKKNCVMCGKLRVCSATSLVNRGGTGRGGTSPKPPKTSSCDNVGSSDNMSPSFAASKTDDDNDDSSTTHIIPRQNKGLCTACDVTVWVVVSDGLEIKWCKGCKNFRPWAAFGDKGSATKCVRCRDRQREKYAMQKDEIRLRRYNNNNNKAAGKDTSKTNKSVSEKAGTATPKIVMKSGWEEKKVEDHHLDAARGLRKLMNAA